MPGLVQIDNLVLSLTQKRIDLIVEQCSPIRPIPPEEETQVVFSTDVPSTPAIPKKPTFTESANYIVLLGAVYLVLITAVIYSIVFLVRRK